MDKPKILIFEDKLRLAAAFSHHFINLVKMKEGIFNIALSGGNTPKVWFENLVNNHKDSVAWENIHFYWGDERCVPPDDEESNYGMAAKYLFDHVDVPAENIHRIKGEIAPEEAAGQYARELTENLPGTYGPVFDLIILGMGEDGHTASIFPEQIDLWESPSLCVVASHPVTGQRRISLTGKVINNAASVAFMVTGRNKAPKVREILSDDPAAENYPAAKVNLSEGALYWFIDKGAAEALEK